MAKAKRRIVFVEDGVFVEEYDVKRIPDENPWVRISDKLPDEATAAEQYKGARYRGTGRN